MTQKKKTIKSDSLSMSGQNKSHQPSWGHQLKGTDGREEGEGQIKEEKGKEGEGRGGEERAEIGKKKEKYEVPERWQKDSASCSYLFLTTIIS